MRGEFLFELKLARIYFCLVYLLLLFQSQPTCSLRFRLFRANFDSTHLSHSPQIFFRANAWRKISLFSGRAAGGSPTELDESALSPIQLQIEQGFLIDGFVEHYKNEARAIQGVFLLEDIHEKALVAGFTNDVFRAVKKLELEGDFQGHKMHRIHIQTFLPSQQELAEAYTKELIRLTEPIFPTLAHLFPLNYEGTEEDSEDDDEGNDHKNWQAEQSKQKIKADGVLSPFEDLPVSSSPNTAGTSDSMKITPMQDLEFNFANVDRVLDEIRPYLQADGGNVAVVSVDSAARSVKLLLQGACGSCPSSTTTMKMGIERILKENFRDLGEVSAVDPAEASILTLEQVSQAIEKLLPAIKGLGGSLRISKVDPPTGSVYVDFQGPDRLRKGIELVLKDVKHVKDVIFESTSS